MATKAHSQAKARSELALSWLFGEVAGLHRTQRLASAPHWATLDANVGELQETVAALDVLLQRLLPFSYANLIKFTITFYLLSFPYSIATQLMWFTPFATFGAALVILSMDKVGTLMLLPFASDENHGIDLDKRIRRTDKEFASLLGTWLHRPAAHYDLFPETAKRKLNESGKTHFHRETVTRFRKTQQRLELSAGPTLPESPHPSKSSGKRGWPRPPSANSRDAALAQSMSKSLHSVEISVPRPSLASVTETELEE